MTDECKSREQLLEELKALRSELSQVQEARQEQDRKILEVHKLYDRFRHASLASRDTFGDWDIVNDRMWCGEGMRASLGTPETFGNVFNWLIQIIHPDDRERMSAHLKRLFESDQLWDESEFRVLTAQGAYVDIIFRTFLTRDEHGKPRRMIGLAADNSQRKQMVAELRQSEERYRTIIENMEDGYHETDLEGNFTFFNNACAANLGLSPAEMTGSSMISFLPDKATFHKLDAACGDVLRTGKSIRRFEFDISRKGGLRRTLECSISLIRDEGGRPVGFRGISRDTTDRKRAEEELKKYADEISDLYHNAPCGYHSLSPDGTFLKINNTELSWLGYLSAEVVGEKKWCDLLTPEGIETYEKTFPVLKEKGRIDNVEIDIVRKDGSIIPVLLNATAVRDGSGNFIMSRATLFDMTERRRTEAELRKSKEKISERLNHSQKMEAIGTLAGGIAHDFNNILASIMGFTELIRLRLDQLELDEYLEQILRSCERAKDLVNQILTFGQQKERETKEIDLNDLMTDIIKLLRATLPVTIEIRQNIEAKPHSILADATEIHQIFMNLSANSAYAMRKMGGVLEFALKNIYVDDRNAASYQDLQPGAYVELGISDNGEGIEQANISRIFDPFYTTKERGKGTGLGLAVVYGIVKEYGGYIAVQSDPGKGTLFNIYLPSIEPERAKEIETHPSIPRGNESVLFVDDEETLAYTGMEMLHYLGYDAVSTTSSVEALEIFRTEPDRFDLVITDLTMPSLTGIDLAGELMKIRPEIPIILSTGYSELITEEESKKIGIREFFMKPYSLEQMAQGVRRALLKKQETG